MGNTEEGKHVVCAGEVSVSKPVLVTGATGLVGAAVRDAFLADGQEVIGMWHGREPDLYHLHLRWLRADLEKSGWHANLPPLSLVCHCAAILPGEGRRAEDAADSNRRIDEAAFGVMASRGVPMVYASGTTVYGGTLHGSDSPIAESTPPSPESPYIEEKVWAEGFGERLAKESAVPFAALRICAPYGPKLRAKTVVKAFIERALDRRPICYYGSGSREQSFTHVRDVARAFLLASGHSGVYNIAPANPICMKDLGLLIARLAGLSEEMVRPSREEDPQEGSKSRIDVRLAEQELGWLACVSLEQGLAECIAERRKIRYEKQGDEARSADSEGG